MNYFKVNCVGVIGKKIAMIEVECVQQRRLPYIHVIGGSSGNAASLRERVLAAIESSGFRLPARRFTVSLIGNGQMPSAELDLAVALAILGSAKLFPRARMGKFVVSGALSLDGRLLPLACRAPLRAFKEEKTQNALLLPWEDSHILGAGEGGGFHNLAEVVEFLRGKDEIGPRNCILQPQEGKECVDWRWLRGRPIAQRLLPVCAAGAHPLLITGSGNSRSVAEDLFTLLPPLEDRVREEAESMLRLAGEPSSKRPLREFRADQAGRLLRFDSRAGIFGEMSLAHGGLLFVSDLGDRPLALMRQLQEPLESGCIRSFRGGQSLLFPADWQLVAEADLCLCGGYDKCHCSASEVQKWRQRLDQARAFFPIRYLLEASGDTKAPSVEDLKVQVNSARAMAIARQGMPNNRVRLEDCFRLKSWREDAAEIWRSSRGTSRSEVALARVSLTVSDLRGGEWVQREDVLEARYFVPESFVLRSRSGSSLWSGSVPSSRSTAMP